MSKAIGLGQRPQPSKGILLPSSAVEKPCHFRDVHATILNQLGLAQEELTFLHLGRHERLTLEKGKLIRDIL